MNERKSERMVAQVVPALPGFWAHLMDGDTPNGVRMAVIAWLVDCRALPDNWIGHVDPITFEGLLTQEHFIEQPDGKCFDFNQHADSVDEMRALLAGDAITDTA